MLPDKPASFDWRGRRVMVVRRVTYEIKDSVDLRNTGFYEVRVKVESVGLPDLWINVDIPVRDDLIPVMKKLWDDGFRRLQEFVEQEAEKQRAAEG